MSNSPLSRPRLWAMVSIGGLMFTLVLLQDFLAHSQSLEYLRGHYPEIYAFLVSHDTLTVFAIVGLGLTLWALLELLRSRNKRPVMTDEPVSLPAVTVNVNPSISVSPSNTQIASPTITQQNIQNVPLQASQEQKQFLEQFKLEVKWLQLESESSIWRVKDTNTGVLGLLLPFYNNPARSGPTLKYAKVNLVFVRHDQPPFLDEEKVIVPYAAWVDEEFNWTHLRPGVRKYAILLIVTNGSPNRPAPVMSVGDNRSNAQSLETPRFTPFTQYVISGKNYTVEACIIAGEDQEFRKVYTIPLSLEERRANQVGSN